MENTKPAPKAIAANEGETLSIAGGTYRILLSGAETGGAFATIEMMVPPQGGPGPHAHPDFEETFYVIEGEVEVRSEAGKYIAEKGAYVVIPKGGIVHKFKNISDQPARLLCTVVPSGLEEMFLEIAGSAPKGSPPPPMDEEGIKKMKALAEKFRQTLYPADYLDGV